MISKPKIFFVVLELSLNSTLFYNMIAWYPYFFTAIGFPSYAAYLSIVPSLFYFLVPFVFEPLVSRCENKANYIIIILHFLNLCIYGWLALLGHQISDPGNVSLLFVLIVAQGIIFAGPCVRSTLIEMAIESEGNPTTLYHMYNFFILLQCLLAAISYFLIGYFMERGKNCDMQTKHRFS